MNSKEASIQLAITDYQSNATTSLSAAAKAYGVPRTTLLGRINRRANARLSHE